MYTNFIKLFLICECFAFTSNAFAFFGQMKGKVKEGWYFDQNNMFCLSLPVVEPKIIENLPNNESGSKASSVQFEGDFGELVRVEVWEFPNAFKNSLLEEEKEEDMLKDIFMNCCFNAIKKQFPSTIIKKEKQLKLDKIGNAYFALLEIPNGSQLVDKKTKKRLDSTRGYLISFSGNQLVSISEQQIPMISESPFGKVTDLDEALMNCIIKIRNTYISLSKGNQK